MKKVYPLIFLLVGLAVAVILVKIRQDTRSKASFGPIAEVRLIPHHADNVSFFPDGSVRYLLNPIHFSAMAFDSFGQPVTSGVDYQWGMSSTNSIGSLDIHSSNQMATFTANYYNHGRADIWVVTTGGFKASFAVVVGAFVPAPSPIPSPTPTPTPTPAIIEPKACGGTCNVHSDCQAGLFCYAGNCHNPQCATETSCTCPPPPPTPTPFSSPTPTPTPTSELPIPFPRDYSCVLSDGVKFTTSLKFDQPSFNWGGLNEKWFLENNSQWYYIMPIPENPLAGVSLYPYQIMKWNRGLAAGSKDTTGDTVVSSATGPCYSTPELIAPTPKPCPEDAMQCPGGGPMVTRVGPNCEFAPCPITKEPNPTGIPLGSCFWCGNTCTRNQANLDCNRAMPLPGNRCVEENGACVVKTTTCPLYQVPQPPNPPTGCEYVAKNAVDTNGCDTGEWVLKCRPSDLNTDGKINIFDYNILVSKFGKPYTIFDYNVLVTNYGK